MRSPEHSFDPHQALEKVKNLNPFDRREAYSDFLQNREKQKEGLATLTALMIDSIIADPEISKVELSEIIENFAEETKMSSRQKSKALALIAEYQRRHRQVIERRERYPNDKELFKQCLGVYPKGPIMVQVRPITLHFICSNETDYQMVAGDRRNDKGQLLRSGGVYFPSRQIYSLQNGGMMKLDPQTMVHEETHAMKNLFESTLKDASDRFKEDDFRVTKNLISNTKNLKDKEAYLRHLITRIILTYQRRIKDELFAFLRGGGYDINLVMTKTEDKGGLYDYSHKDQKRLLEYMQKNLKHSDYEFVKSLIPGLFHSKRKKIIGNAVHAMEILKRRGYSKEEIIAFFVDVPLNSWPKEIRRLNRVEAKNGPDKTTTRAVK
jgi:hypothetical protein